MQEINWNNFRAKFNGKEQSSFERLCYLLFCKEFNQIIGISRYKNHAGIETNPIQANNNIIGWQAKFFDTKLSEHKKDFVSSIDTTVGRHPDVNRIIFYTNQEFGQNRKKTDPPYKTDIENYAKSKNIEIEWRTASFFESPFVCEENANIAQHFFGLGRSVIDFINEISLHTELILRPIRAEIIFEGNKIKIDRSRAMEDLKEYLSSSSLIIISGEAGVGKTAIIKDFYDLVKETTPFFVFKAMEFNNISNVNQLLKNYGNFTLLDFMKAHQGIDEKYIVIDSAEKLSDIEYQEVFQEFLSAVINNNWKTILTTRHSYLDDLKYQFIEIYNINFHILNITNLTTKELVGLAETHKFNLPRSERLCKLLRNPFYLNEYLKNHSDVDVTTSYSDFKNILWNGQISKLTYRKNNTHIKRENCFLNIAKKRANSGQFFVKGDKYSPGILQKLESDEIIKYDSNAGGYFITHDIYEEWALDKIIERSFCESEDYKSFYQDIGSSLPIRRAFRNWLSEKLFLNNENAKALIESTINNNQIESHWKVEILVSVLLSDYSNVFFERFEKELLRSPQKIANYGRSSKVVKSPTADFRYEDSLLHKILFLLRIACKEIDESLLGLLGLSKIDGMALKTLFTKPRGRGWDCVIDFINKNKEELGLRYMSVILPVFDDWNNKNKQGETTKNASRVALFYYDEIAKSDSFGYGSRDETKNQIIRIILNGSFEIKEELTNVFNEVISKKEVGHRSKYYDLIHTILSSATDSFEIAKNLPEQVISLADLFWFQLPDETGWRSELRIGVEQYFCLPEHHLDYFPSSAFQTPIFQLLRFAPKQTVDFILSFTNKTVECYSKSELKDEVEEVEVFIDETQSIKQYISNRLWNMYRGTQVSAHLLESVHMALEKWLLENVKTTPKDNFENWCLYLIKNSKSASITSVVASVVLAQPSKLFNIARILFRTKKFFLYDTGRMLRDQTAKSQFSIGYGLNFQHRIYQDERIKTCDDKHRQISLEHLAVNYQFFRSQEESEQEAKEKQKILWNIFDEYYKQLPEKSKESEADRTWRLYLARMDRRKMSPTTEMKDGQIIISFNPEIDPDLKKYSEESLKKSSEAMKYTSLKLWANYKWSTDEDGYKQYEQYDNNPKLVISETKEIIEELKKSTDENYSLFNHSIPAYSCSVLIRDYFEKLDDNEKKVCKEVIIGFASIPLQSQHYSYQIADGTEPSILILPVLLKHFPEEKEKIKSLLFLLLIASWGEISSFATRSIINLWEISFEDAHSIFLGYLLLKPKYDDLRELIRKENYKKKVYEILTSQVFERFIKKYGNEIENVISTDVNYKELPNFNELDLDTLKTAFELLPLKTKNEDHKRFLNIIFPIFSKKLFIDDDRTDYMLKHRFLEKLAYFILTSKREEIEIYLKPFLDDFSISRDTADFFSEFVSAEDKLNQYEEFWIVWNLFYPNIVRICKDERSQHYTKGIVHNYLLAWPYWREDAKEWHTLKDREKLFFKKVAENIGNHTAVLYSISKLLNDIGSGFRDDGIFWISNILQKNQDLITRELETNTIYYIENLVRGYILKNRHKVKTNHKIKKQIIVILNFLLEKGSVTGYLLREDIL